MIPVRAMVMAAGAGTRLQPLTHAVPKPMVPIVNRPVLQYTLENLRRHGITEVILNLHSHPDMIRDYFRDGADFGLHISYSHEPKLLGTAGGVKKVEAFLSRGTFLVMSGDGLTTADLTSLLAFHARKKAFGTIGLKPVETRFDYGVTLTNAKGKITRFIEKPSWSDVFSNQVNTGIYVFEPEALKLMPKGKSYDFGHEFWPLLLKKQKAIYGFPIQEYWCDVGNLSEYRRAQRDALDGLVPIPMPGRQIRPGVWVGEGTRMEQGVKLKAPCVIGREGHIRRGAVIGPHTLIGHRVKIGPSSQVVDSVLWDDVAVEAKVQLNRCIVANQGHIKGNISLFDGVVVK